MSNRTLVELNHDYCPRTDADLLKWAESLRDYMRSGNHTDLPQGVTFKGMRHHSHDEREFLKGLITYLTKKHHVRNR